MKVLLLAVALVQLPDPDLSKGRVSVNLACAEIPETVRVVIANTGDVAAGVLLGDVIGNYRWYQASALVFETAQETFHHAPPEVSVIGGRVDPWVLVLPKASSFSFTVKALDLVSARRRLLTFSGDVRVSLTGRALPNDPGFVIGMPLRDLWSGSVVSSTLNTSTCRK